MPNNVYWSRPSVSLSVHCRITTLTLYCTYPDIGWANSKGCPLVVQCSADLQSVHGFRCYRQHSAEREMSASACTRCMPG